MLACVTHKYSCTTNQILNLIDGKTYTTRVYTIHLYGTVCVCSHIYIYIHVDVDVDVCIYICIYIYIYTHIRLVTRT